MNSRFPPIDLFDDVADAEEFDALHALQAATNPRLLAQAGAIEMLPTAEIPFGIPGCSYAVAPFTHLNPDGSRFGDGTFGVLYTADSIETAIKEVGHHQNTYWRQVSGFKFERLVLRGLKCTFEASSIRNAASLGIDHPVHDPQSYDASRRFGRACFEQKDEGIQYLSARAPGQMCWALLTPSIVQSIVQAAHYSMVWNGERITSVNSISSI